MLKTNDTKQRPMVVYNASQLDNETARRFIVPVTNPEADLTAIAQRVWELSNATGSRVQFLGLCKDAMHEPGLRRALATISAMVNFGNVSAESDILIGRDWVESVKLYIRDGDTVICWKGQRAELLQANLNVPIHLIPEINPRSKPRSNWPARAAAWIGSIAIIIFFFSMQVEFDHLGKGWTVVLQLLSIAGEFGLIWFWNNLLG
jgi:hypothetical protein